MLTDADLEEVLVWKERIETNIQSAIKCYKRISDNHLFEDKDLLAALARYIENTAESITQLDNLTNKELFAELIEIPVDSNEEEALTWKNLKGIRLRLAHKFWDMDHDIILNTVRDNFPVLEILFQRLLINENILQYDDTGTVTFERSHVSLAMNEGAEPPPFGKYFIAMQYYVAEGWTPVRVAFVENPKGFVSGVRFATLKQSEGGQAKVSHFRLQGKNRDEIYFLE